MNYVKELSAALAVFAVSVLLGILVHGLFSCQQTLPVPIEPGEAIDSFSASDSEAVLYRSGDGQLYLLEYQKNWLMPRRELKEWTLIHVQPYHTAVTSALTAYPVTVDADTLTADSQPETRLRWAGFSDAYGMEILLLLLAGTLIDMNRTKKK